MATYRETHLIVVADSSPELEAVKMLWRRNSATLGFFPDGAFAEYAQRGQIIAAEREGSIVGYTLFRRTGTRVAIVHLCVHPIARGAGIARQLVDEISRSAADADGVSLRCRRDFEADRLWPKLGFRPVRELRGRGRDGALLVLWFKSHGNDDLFSVAAKKKEPRTVAVVDANVFFDLAEAEERTPNESKALMADWLRDIVELRITSELFDEIGRHADAEVRRHNLEFAAHFDTVECDPDELDSARRVVREILPAPENHRDRSDREHLARCIAARVGYFVTRDDLLREYADSIWERTRVEVLRPSEFISDLDEIERAEAYRPARLAGTSMRVVPAKELTEQRVADAFRGVQRRSEFLALLRNYIASPRTHATHVVLAANEPVALLSRSSNADGCFDVPLMRAAGPDARTLASYLAHQIKVEAVDHGASVVVIPNSGLDTTTREAVEADDFALADDAWMKMVCPVVGMRDEIRTWVAEARARSSRPAVEKVLTQLEEQGAFEFPAAALERLFWPVKVLDASLPTFVVPVRANWAKHLFDAELAGLDLFGATPHLAMSRENVYYRAATNPASLPSPARLLWYVSADARTPGTKAIRACSRLVDVMVGTPKAVYKAGRRLGIYEWKDVERTATKSRDGQVQSLRFCDTQCFRAPVPLERVHRILEEHAACNVNRSFPGPQQVPEDVFAAIYRAGTEQGAAGAR
jgi:GNAT superfamily N-acetyltransferase/predicted nucleic acid-binding protein